MKQEEIKRNWEQIAKNLVTSQVETITAIKMLEENIEKIDNEINKFRL